jgi:hypothetical protein
MQAGIRGVCAAALAVPVLALSACGSGGDSTTSSSAFTTRAKAAVASVKSAGASLGATLNGADKQSDKALAAQLTANQKEIDAALAKVKALDPSEDSDKAAVDALATSLATASADVGALADAADVSDAKTAKTAAEKLAADSGAVKAADHALDAIVNPGTATTTTG